MHHGRCRRGLSPSDASGSVTADSTHPNILTVNPAALLCRLLGGLGNVGNIAAIHFNC